MVRSLDGAASAAVYLPWHQFSVRYSTTVLVRASRGGAAALAPSVLGVIRELDPLLPAFRQLTLDEVRNSATKNERIGAIVLAIFGALALVLASVGLYGALLFSVRQRTREIGIRVALGATRAGVISLFLRRGLRLTFIGVAIGVVLALASTRLTRTLLFGVSPTDGVTFAAVALLFTGVAIIASWLPARRAARVDPVIAMRAD
jgi:ABC-type antimicrobial peptide transport system permease subunit